MIDDGVLLRALKEIGDKKKTEEKWQEKEHENKKVASMVADMLEEHGLQKDRLPDQINDLWHLPSQSLMFSVLDELKERGFVKKRNEINKYQMMTMIEALREKAIKELGVQGIKVSVVRDEDEFDNFKRGELEEGEEEEDLRQTSFVGKKDAVNLLGKGHRCPTVSRGEVHHYLSFGSGVGRRWKKRAEYEYPIFEPHHILKLRGGRE